jgi:hypothetical protein
MLLVSERIRKFMPSKRIGVLLICCILVIVLAGLSKGGRIFVQKVFNTEGKSRNLEVSLTYGDLIERDSDGDGVKDWEESLWGTDKNNPDTDGDGEGDAEEIATLRAEKNGGAPTSLSDLDETDQFAREFFATTIALSESGNLSESSIASLAENYAGGAVSWKQETIYTDTDLKTTAVTATSKSTYENAITQIFSTYNVGSIDYINSIPSYIEDRNVDSLSVLQTTSQIYSNSVTSLLEVMVPIDAVPAHLSLINSLENHFEIIESIINIDSNPIRSLAGISYFTKSMESITNAILMTQAYIDGL